MHEKLKTSLDADLSRLVWDARSSQEVLRTLRRERAAAAQPRRMRLAPLMAALTACIVFAVSMSLWISHPRDHRDPVNSGAPVITGGFQPLAESEPTLQVVLTNAPSLVDGPLLAEEPSDDLTTGAPAPTATATASPTPTPVVTPTLVPALIPGTLTPPPTVTATTTPELATLTDLYVADRSGSATPSPTPTVTPTATPSPTPTVIPTPTPDPATIVYEDDLFVVTQELCENDLFHIYSTLRVVVKDASRHALVGSRLQEVPFHLEAYLVSAQVLVVDSPLLIDAQNQVVTEAFTAMSKTISAQADGSVWVECVCSVQPDGSFTPDTIHTQLTFTPATGKGITATFQQPIPAAPEIAEPVRFVPDAYREGYHDEGQTRLHTLEDYSYLSVRFTLEDIELPANTHVLLSKLNGESGSFGMSEVSLNTVLGERGNVRSEYLHLLFQLDEPPAEVTSFTIRAISADQPGPLFTASYTREDLAVTATPVPTPTPTPTATPSPTPTATPSPTPTATPTPTPTATPSPTPTATPSPTPTATPTPAPTATPNPAAIIFEDDRLVVTRERCDNDMFYIRNDLRVAVKDTSRYVLVADPADAPQDGREVILMVPRMECVTDNFVSSIRSFDVQNTDSASYRLMSQLESTTYHVECFSQNVIRQDDGSLLIQGEGMTTDMQNPYGGALYILDALTFTDITCSTGRTEIITRRLPSSPNLPRTVYEKMFDRTSFTVYGMGAQSSYYQQEDSAYFSVKFTLSDRTGGQPILLRVTALDGVPGDYASCIAQWHVVETEPWNNVTEQFYHAPIYLDGVTECPYFITLEGYLPETGEHLFTSTYQYYRYSDLPRIAPATPTPTPTLAPTPTPAPTPAPALPAAVPSDSVGYSYINLSGLQIPANLSLDSAQFRAYEGFNAAVVSLRYLGDVPEDAILRITERNNQTGDFGEAPLTWTQGNLLTSGIVTQALGLHDLYQLKLACIDPATGGTIFEFALMGREYYSIYDGNGRPIKPRPTQPPLPEIFTVHGTGSALSADAVKNASIPEDAAILARYPLEVADKPRKYSHFSAALLVTEMGGVLEPTFKYHDPLPEGAYLRLVSIDGEPAESTGGLITRMTSSGQELLTARVCVAQVPARRCSFLLEAIHPDTGEILFSFVLQQESNQISIPSNSYNPSEPHFNPVPNTPKPGQSIFDWWNGMAGGYPGYGY